MLASWLRIAILGLSGIAVGLSLWLGAAEVVRLLASGTRRHLGFAARNVGRAIVVGLVAEAVFRAARIPWTWRVGVYLFGLFLMDAGIITDLVDFGRRDRRDGDHP